MGWKQAVVQFLDMSKNSGNGRNIRRFTGKKKVVITNVSMF